MYFKRLVKLFPEEKDLKEGDLRIDKHGDATFTRGYELLAILKRVRIELVSANGMLISGLEPNGHTKSGQERFCYQEWWLVGHEGAKT